MPLPETLAYYGPRSLLWELYVLVRVPLKVSLCFFHRPGDMALGLCLLILTLWSRCVFSHDAHGMRGSVPDLLCDFCPNSAKYQACTVQHA